MQYLGSISNDKDLVNKEYVDNVADMIADEYSSSSTYSVGDYCIYNGDLYECTTLITTAEAWTSSHWTQIQVTNEVGDLKSALGDVSIQAFDQFGVAKRTNVTVPKGSTRAVLLTVDLTAGVPITFSIKLKTAVSVNTYLYLRTATGTDLFPGTSRGIISGTTTNEYTYTPSSDYSLCQLQYTIPNSASADAEFEYVSATAKGILDTKFNEEWERNDETHLAIGKNTYFVQDKTGIVSNYGFTVKKGTNQKTLLYLDLQKGNKITIKGKLKAGLSVNTYLYLQDAEGNNLFSASSYGITAGTTTFSTTYTPLQDYIGCFLKYTIANNATANAEFEYLCVQGNVQAAKYMLEAHHSTIVSEDVVQNIYTYPVLYKADSITFKTSGENYSGIHIRIFDNIAIGEAIRLKGKRSAGNNWSLRIDFRDSSGQRIGSEVVTYETETTRIIPEGTAQVTIALAGCWGTPLAENTSVTFTDVEICYAAIEDIVGDGTNLYNGEKIVLTNTPKQQQKCSISRWKNFLGTEIPDLSDYKLYLNQSMTIYGDYVFLFQEGGTALILDYETKAILSEATVGPTSGQHHNSAQFTDLYYDSEDEFPLLITARCGNSNRGASDGDECQIYRVTRSGSDFTFTLVNRIFCSTATKGSSWGIDNVTNQLYMIGVQTAWWESGEKLPLIFGVWAMPDIDTIKSGTDITLTIAECIAETTLPNMTIQGMAVHGGKIFVGVSAGTQYVYVIDVYAERVLSIVPLTVSIEVEGVAVYDSKLYVSQKRGSDTEGTNPCEIYEITF